MGTMSHQREFWGGTRGAQGKGTVHPRRLQMGTWKNNRLGQLNKKGMGGVKGKRGTQVLYNTQRVITGIASNTSIVL